MRIEDPVARLSAAVTEDEAAARAADESFAPDWRAEGPMDDQGRWSVWADTEIAIGLGPMEVAQHIARHDPAREVFEVALKRLILEQHSGVIIDGPDHWVTVPVCRECTKWGRQVHDYAPWPCDYIKALQAIYPEVTA